MSLLNKSLREMLYKYGIKRVDKKIDMSKRIMCNVPCALPYDGFIENIAMDAYSYIIKGGMFYNTKIGRYCSIADYCYIGFPCQDLNGTATSALFIDDTDFAFAGYDAKSMHLRPNCMPSHRAVVEIEHDVWLGHAVHIVGDVKIGTGAAIGTKAVITKDVPPYSVVVGNDRIIRQRFSDEVISDLLESQWWLYDMPAMAEAGVELPYTQPELLLKVLKDLDPEQLIPIQDKWISFDIPEQTPIVKTFNGRKIKPEEVTEFFEQLKRNGQGSAQATA